MALALPKARPAALQQPEALMALLRARDVRTAEPAASRRRAELPRAPELQLGVWRTAQDVRHVHGARRLDAHHLDARHRVRGVQDALPGAPTVRAQRSEPAQRAVLRGEPVAGLAVSDGAAELPRAQDAAGRLPEAMPDVAGAAGRRRAAEAEPGARPAALRREAGAELVVRPVEALRPAVPGVVQQPAVGPSEHPSVRLPLPVGLPAQAGSAHQRSMRMMQSLQAASRRTRSSPATRDEVLS
ncbi:hypothetical protein [Tardiphaga alba]